MKLFPLFLDLNDKPILVVGNGFETELRTEQLLACGAKVTVIAPFPLPKIARLQATGKIHFIAGEVKEQDVKQAWLVFCTTRDHSVIELVTDLAHRYGVFCNVSDHLEQCSAIVPAIIQYHDLRIALSSAGKSPALLQVVKNIIHKNVGPDYGLFNELLGSLRPQIRQRVKNFEDRKQLYFMLARDPKALEWIGRGEMESARLRLQQIIDAFIAESQEVNAESA